MQTLVVPCWPYGMCDGFTRLDANGTYSVREAHMCVCMCACRTNRHWTHPFNRCQRCYSSSSMPMCDFVYLVCASFRFVYVGVHTALSLAQLFSHSVKSFSSHANSALTPNETVIIRSCVISKLKHIPVIYSCRQHFIRMKFNRSTDDTASIPMICIIVWNQKKKIQPKIREIFRIRMCVIDLDAHIPPLVCTHARTHTHTQTEHTRWVAHTCV